MTGADAETVSIFGFFTEPGQTKAVYDPGLDVLCPLCLQKLERPVKTISLLLPGDSRSFFYRTHKHCYDTATDEAVQEIESSLIDTRGVP